MGNEYTKMGLIFFYCLFNKYLLSTYLECTCTVIGPEKNMNWWVKGNFCVTSLSNIPYVCRWGLLKKIIFKAV